MSGLLALGMLTARAQSDATERERATDVVQSLHAGLVAAAAKETQHDIGARYEALRPLVARTHDLETIARLTIRRQWDSLTSEQQQRFLAAFERLSVMTYASRFGSVTGDTFALLGADDADGGRVQVHAAIKRVDDDDIALDYLLQASADGWRIINILADHVSDLALKRAEYQSILSSGSIEDLIDEIDAQTARLR